MKLLTGGASVEHTTLQYCSARLKWYALQECSVERRCSEIPHSTTGQANTWFARSSPQPTSEHCWVYDAKLDQTIDATLGQFFIPGAKDDWWNGEEHPMAEETDEFHSIEEFAKGPGGTALLEA
jgi:hypothetical protein